MSERDRLDAGNGGGRGLRVVRSALALRLRSARTEVGARSTQTSPPFSLSEVEGHAETSPYRANGFTLVELMVVITVIGLASAIAVWSLPDRRGRVTDEALRFAARVRAAHDVAVVEASPVSIWVTRGGYGFDRRADGAWSPMTAKPLRVAQWEDGTQAAIPDPSGRVRITFDVTGLADRPVELRLTRDRASSIVRIGADGTVRVDG